MSEQAAILAEYERRAAELPPTRYAPWTPGQVFARQSRERAVLALLRRNGLLPLDATRILDVGCGDGQWLVDFETWGADRALLAGIDLVEERAAEARARLAPPAAADGGVRAGADVRHGDARRLPWPDASFDLVVQSMAFSSMPTREMQAAVAAEMTRVLAPGGHVLWHDFVVANPRNPRLHPVRRRDLAALFPAFAGSARRTTLAPPLARTLAPRARLLAELLEASRLPTTHLLALLRKPAGTPCG